MSINNPIEPASKPDIAQWFERGRELGATHMLVVCDRFDYFDYTIYVMPGQNAREVFEHYDGKNMQSVMEVYRLDLSMEEQLKAKRAFNF